ncbi:MAG: TetR/AcrR family transcriptional regulator [Chitinivibrionia bacterium]|nr:TetR/AcrR family transcriptional regulator [Chitinivibrionia bacterium]
MLETTQELDKQEKAALVSDKVKALKSELILDAALTVFSLRGVAEATLEEIAGEAGFSKASLYNYFPDKERIFLAVAMREAERFIDILMNSGETSVSPTLPFKENMRRYLLLRLEHTRKHFHFIVSMNLAEIFKCEDIQKGSLHGYIDFKEELFKKSIVPILNWAKDKNEITTLFNDLTLCRIIDGMTLGVIHDWIKNKKVGDTDEVANLLIELLVNGMGKR